MKKVLFVVCLITCFCFLTSSIYAEQSGKNPSLVEALKEALPGEFASLGEFAAAGGDTIVGFPERAKGVRLLSSSDITLTRKLSVVPGGGSGAGDEPGICKGCRPICTGPNCGGNSNPSPRPRPRPRPGFPPDAEPHSPPIGHPATPQPPAPTKPDPKVFPGAPVPY